MGSSSKDLLHLENKYFSTPSSLESILRVCDKDSGPKKRPTDEKPLTNPVPQSQVLGKVRDFLGVISEANKRLQADAKENSEEYDIEVLTGNESEVVEMDLMLGIADLHTPEAVAAAEAAISGGQSMISLAAGSSETESEDTSDESESDDGASDDTKSNGEDNADDNIKTCKSGKSDSTEGENVVMKRTVGVKNSAAKSGRDLVGESNQMKTWFDVLSGEAIQWILHLTMILIPERGMTCKA